MALIDDLEEEAVWLIREVVATTERPVILFSGGKDSAVLVHLAIKAFRPVRPPVHLLHVDTGHNFPEVLSFIARTVRRTGLSLITASVPSVLAGGPWYRTVPADRPDRRPVSRNQLQSPVLLQALQEMKVDAAIGGARRDEDRARAKEHLVSIRYPDGSWDPGQQSPEPWGAVSTAAPPDGHVRAFPLADWTERDIWSYIADRGIDVPCLYYAHRRRLVRRQDRLFAVTDAVPADPGEIVFTDWCRFRTVGDVVCTAASPLRSDRSAGWPATPLEVLEDLLTVTVSERGSSRADDDGEAAMEDRKAQGYF